MYFADTRRPRDCFQPLCGTQAIRLHSQEPRDTRPVLRRRHVKSTRAPCHPLRRWLASHDGPSAVENGRDRVRRGGTGAAVREISQDWIRAGVREASLSADLPMTSSFEATGCLFQSVRTMLPADEVAPTTARRHVGDASLLASGRPWGTKATRRRRGRHCARTASQPVR